MATPGCLTTNEVLAKIGDKTRSAELWYTKNKRG